MLLSIKMSQNGKQLGYVLPEDDATFPMKEISYIFPNSRLISKLRRSVMKAEIVHWTNSAIMFSSFHKSRIAVTKKTQHSILLWSQIQGNRGLCYMLRYNSQDKKEEWIATNLDLSSFLVGAWLSLARFTCFLFFYSCKCCMHSKA